MDHTPIRNKTTARHKAEERVLTITAFFLVIGILAQKLSVPLGAGTPLEITILLEYLLIFLLLATNRAHIDLTVLFLLLLFCAGAVTLSLVTAHSLTSLLLVLVLYMPLAVRTEVSRPTYFRLLGVFQMLAAFSSCMILADWAFQFAGLPMPNMEHLLPEQLKFVHYNYIQPLEWGSKWYKPNGFFYLEVSYLAQIIATGIVIEICFFRRFAYLALLAVAQILTFSGTGFLLLAACIPVVLPHLKPKIIAAAVVLAPIAVITAASMGVFDNVAKRSEDFARDGSSANQRFVAQYDFAIKNLSHQSVALTGIGAGQMPEGPNIVWTPATKVANEYGILVGGVFFASLLAAIFRGSTPFAVGYALAVQFLFLNGGFLVPVNIFLFIMLTTLVKIGRPSSTWSTGPPQGDPVTAPQPHSPQPFESLSDPDQERQTLSRRFRERAARA
ncbi:hypothetical protein B2G71_05230 [Novosphingobium sp. PC22D]|uniref:hypothetical protein n=1 Tax=Novosphingobium sp. PC22D TaxID=1962403 RepID=UPI000BF11A71|nr:hypothetical protein [Novosphingobium sp. PC22D]PEQ13724.1 hypothetical protein B2G71_05230 [Novosphingobium sp. PC22D]